VSRALERVNRMNCASTSSTLAPGAVPGMSRDQ
jgi:hypothetical protein